MTEKVLPYDRSIVGQETGYWCGPASTQVVLNSRGIIVPEATLAREIGTTVNGTDYVGLIERILDQRVPDARYTSVYLNNDPPTPAEKERLWGHLKQSIDAGFGVVMNWVAPPGNKPRGVKGSVSPRYSGGTTYHYVAAMGYDDDPAGRAVWIADSGFQPQGYWVSFDQCATLIPPKGYAYADVGVPPQAPVAPQADVLMRVMGGTIPFDRYRALVPQVARSLQLCRCDNLDRVAMWCAQIGHESGGLRWQEEIADGSAYNGRADLGNVQPGDGPRFKGRDFIQITGRANYASLSVWAHARGIVPTPTFFVNNPTALATDKYAFVGVAWYWTVARPDINYLADSRDLETVTRRINGGLNGLQDRRARYNRALAMGRELLTLLNTEGDDFMAQLSQADADLLVQAAKKIVGVWPSRSIYRANNNTVDDTVGMLLNVDGSVHELVIEHRALLGYPDAVALVRETAEGRSAGSKLGNGQPDTKAMARAQFILDKISERK